MEWPRSAEGRSITTRGKCYFIEVAGDQELAGKGRPQSKDETEISVRVGLQLGWATSGDIKIKIKNEEDVLKCSLVKHRQIGGDIAR